VSGLTVDILSTFCGVFIIIIIIIIIDMFNVALIIAIYRECQKTGEKQ